GLGQSRLSQEFLAGKYEDLTKQLAQSPAEFKAALEQDLSNALKRSDDLLASRNYEKLENQLDELSEIYGPRPELNIRKGIAQIQRGEINSAAQSFNESILNQGGQGRNLFFDEINLRLQNTASPQQPLVQVAYDNKIFSINCKVKNLPDAVSVRPENIDLDSAVFYVENNPRLNNLDWNTNVQASLNQAIEGEFGEVVRLPSGGLDNYRPTRIYAEDTGQVFESIQQKTTPSNFRLPVIVGRNPRCDEEREDQKHCGDIYIIRTRPGN
ncbi:MAG TPA: hypothetical protein VFX63_18060, partial [Pyrinomonadaceae bacterium]|nr:hypothetical protein [Pyrinomonadaceae bacterium]